MFIGSDCRLRGQGVYFGSFLAFAPFLIFVVLERTVGVEPGLIAATIVAAILLIRDVLSHKAIKVLDVGTLILFGGLAVYYKIESPDWSVFAVRLRVDLGLLIIVLASMVLRKPFTLQYAREQLLRNSGPVRSLCEPTI